MRRYDDGCTAITNIDFSALVIKQMMAKNLRPRPRMRWQVMDMTQTKARSPAVPARLHASLRAGFLPLWRPLMQHRPLTSRSEACRV
jgi:hypothetical protein